MSAHRKAIVDAFRDGYEGSLADLAWQLGIPSREVRHVVNPLTVAGFIVLRPQGGFRWNGTTRKKAPMTDPKDLKLPTTTKEFAQYLRDIAEQVDRIPDRPLQLSENDVEIGFYYGHPTFPQMPTGLHFAINFASTELRK
jgi:hypothetical protein